MSARAFRLLLAWLALGGLLPLLRAETPLPPREAERVFKEYKQVIDRTAGMVADQAVQKRAAAFGLQVLNLTWEDTARTANSALGPNISDMTIQVVQKRTGTNDASLTCMPVIRYPNFTDKTADVRPEQFFLQVGNEKGKALERISLHQYLGNLRLYLNKPQSWKGDQTYLLAKRDTHVLVSAQACFLPVPKAGIAEFNPVLFNYQSRKGDPAVLTILATREGTSATIIDNQRDGFQSGGSWGQRLFFNKKGRRAIFTGQRVSDFQPDPAKNPGVKPAHPNETVEAAAQVGLNVVLLIQVPLKQKEQDGEVLGADNGTSNTLAKDKAKSDEKKSDVEEAVIGHGKVEGPYTEMDGLAIERDERFPIRVTVQFYKATSNGVVTESDMAAIAGQIKAVYARGDYVGSLVTDGKKGRPTEHEFHGAEHWERFWDRFKDKTGKTRAEAVAKIREAKGADWQPATEVELAEAAELLPREAGGPPLMGKTGWYGVLAAAAAGVVLLAALYLRRRPVGA
jgi:hypothetical protein